MTSEYRSESSHSVGHRDAGNLAELSHVPPSVSPRAVSSRLRPACGTRLFTTPGAVAGGAATRVRPGVASLPSPPRLDQVLVERRRPRSASSAWPAQARSRVSTTALSGEHGHPVRVLDHRRVRVGRPGDREDRPHRRRPVWLCPLHDVGHRQRSGESGARCDDHPVAVVDHRYRPAPVKTASTAPAKSRFVAVPRHEPVVVVMAGVSRGRPAHAQHPADVCGVPTRFVRSPPRWCGCRPRWLQADRRFRRHLDGVRPWHIWHYRAEVATLVDY